MYSWLNDFDALELHKFIEEYNWDDGFEQPLIVINSDNCDLGTAILCFYRAGGYRYLDEYNDSLSYDDEDWYLFCHSLFTRITGGFYDTMKLSFSPKLTKVQKYKIRKNIPDIDDVLVNGV